jgi:hypothetical protein
VNACKTENSIFSNGNKTILAIFRKGGKLGGHEYFICGQDKLGIVTNFKYLGITPQTSGTSFTRHSGQSFKCKSSDS